LSQFVDASALVAYIAGEPDRPTFIEALEAEPDNISSAMACWETVLALRRTHKFDIERAREDVERTMAVIPLRLVPIGTEELAAALDAYQKYGKGRHPAQLNMGDCFAYACTKTNNARLLYKGDDFSKTDLA
jgi:ribonuclease VapC